MDTNIDLFGYQITEELYSGNRTLVYRGMREADQQPVVIKLLRNEFPSFNELVQFRNQYIIAKNLNFPSIIATYSLENYQNSYALVMEDFGGVSLKHWTKESGLSLESFLQIAINLCTTLNILYQERIIHKDIKPANILINPATKEIKLIDFSIASLLPRETQEIQNANSLEGTLAYISPEQTGRMNRGIDYRSDFYSLGVTFYKLLTGTLPFQSNDPMELIHCHLAKVPISVHEINPQIPLVLSEIISKLMAKNAEDRYQSALGIKHDLEICLQQFQSTGQITDFAIGQRDISDRFTIPEKLYGREREVNQLLEAFDRVAGVSPQPPLKRGASEQEFSPLLKGGRGGSPLSNSELMLVAGFSGIGKTAVVNEVHKPITKQKGYFIKGKYDQFQRNIPFSAFVQAFRDLMGQLLSESDAQLQTWKAKILEVVGDNGQILVDVIPELELIIGKQSPVTELSGSSAQNRFNLLMRNFIKVFTSQEHPLVMFIDDLQWSDSASQNLLKLLMQDTKYLLILGAYRDNEVSPAHPFILTVDEIIKAGAVVNTITLQPLSLEDTNQLVADTLNCELSLAQPLTKLVYQKTKGNPFFATQFLKALHDDKLISFNPPQSPLDKRERQGGWQCDIAQVIALAPTDDVVEFMALQLQKLPTETQDVLKLAACIGAQFDLQTLAIIYESLAEDTARALQRALLEGLIIPNTESYKFFMVSNSELVAQTATEITVNSTYRFFHDRIQQAAYFLIDEDQRQATHYQIGQLLIEKLSQTEQRERIFDIVSQMNIGRHLLDQKSYSQQESKFKKIQLAKLNLAAGQKARLSIAYTAAVDYFNVGISLLGQDAWNTEYQLMLQLHRNLAEVQLSQGYYFALDTVTSTILDHVTVASDRADIYVILVIQNTLQGNYQEAIQIGLNGLAELEIEVDRTQLAEVNQRELAEIETKLESRSISELIDLPLTTVLSVQASIKLLMILDPPTYIIGDIETYAFISLTATRLSIQHGNITESIKAYANYGLLIGLMRQQYQRGYEFADLAVQLSHKLNSPSQRSKACLLLGAWIQVWAKPISGAANVNYEGFLAGIDSGEIQFAGYNLFGNIANRIFQGEPLESIALDVEKYWGIATEKQNELLLVALAGANLYVQKLLLQSDSEGVSHQEQFMAQNFFSEADLIERAQTSESWFSLCFYYILKMHLTCLSTTFEEGLSYITEASKIITSIVGFTTYSSYFYYASLILLNRYSELSTAEQNETLQQVQSNQQKLQQWTESCPENFLHKYFLVEAELHKALGNKSEAIESYDKAISGAKVNEYIQEEALANELAAKFFLAWGKGKIAASYMQEAYYCYAKWGAKAKVDDLETRYPQLLEPILHQPKVSFDPLETLIDMTHTLGQTATSNTNIADTLDFVSVLKAAQTISSEINLDELLRQLTQIILQNSGADRCVLILLQDETWQVRAISTLESTELCGTSLNDNHAHVPLKLIQYVKRTQTVVVVNNLQTDLPVIDDYLSQHQPKSILGLPILNQGNLGGIIYLENQATTGVFTSDRLTVINFLCTQAAISLDNARLYASEQEKSQALKQIAQDLEKFQTKLMFLINKTPMAVIEWNSNFEVISWNPAAEKIFGYKAEEMLNDYALKIVPEPYHPYVAQVMTDLLNQQGGIYSVNENITKNGDIIICEWINTPLLDENNNSMGIYSMVQDITERKQAEAMVTQKSQELAQALENLQQTQLQMIQTEKMSALGNLVAGVAHEINNPVGFLNGNIQPALDYINDLFGLVDLYQQKYPQPDTDIQQEIETIELDYIREDLPKLVSSMQEGVKRIQDISTSLRTFSRGDSDRPVTCNIHEGIDSTVMILKHRLKANESRPEIQVVKNYGNLPQIECYAGQLNQVFMNILANAIDALDESNHGRSFDNIKAKPNCITITTSVENNIVKIAIADNGKGMSEEVKSKVFDHLFTTKKVGKGTGLGLAIARQIIVEKHEGSLEVKSQVGQGTEFAIGLIIKS